MKLLIVDDQISNQFKLIDQLQTYLKLQPSDIKIASNGLEAVTMAEKHDLDLVLMDIYMPVMNGLIATEIIANKFKHIKVIIISGSDDKSLLQKSIDVGAEGYLFKENLETNLISVIQNVNNGYTVFPKKYSNDINMINSSNIIIEPTESDKILKINNIIALDIIKTWIYNVKSFSFEEDILHKFINNKSGEEYELINHLIFGDTPKCNLIQELELRFDYLVSNLLNTMKLSSTDLEQKLNTITKQLDYWFSSEEITRGTQCYKSRIEANAQTIRIKSIEKLQKYIKNIFPKTSPASCLEHLESIEKVLKGDIIKYEHQLNKFSQQEKSAFKAYNTLIIMVSKIDKKELNQENINSLNRALWFIYQAKMKIEVFTFAVHLTQGMIRSLQFYIDDLLLTIKLLQSIRNQLSIFEVDDSISYFITQKFSIYRDPLELLQEIESEVGYSLNQWGVQGLLNSNLVLDKMLDKISATSASILEDIEQELSF